MNILNCVTAGEDNVAQDVVEVVEEDGFESIKRDWDYWKYRRDLFDYVVMKSVEFIAGFINQVGSAKIRTLATLFIKRLDIVDQVLEKIEYKDSTLILLINGRLDLAEFPESFFKAIDEMEHPTNQELAVKWCIQILSDAQKDAPILPLINALEKRLFNGRTLKILRFERHFIKEHFMVSNIL